MARSTPLSAGRSTSCPTHRYGYRYITEIIPKLCATDFNKLQHNCLSSNNLEAAEFRRAVRQKCWNRVRDQGDYQKAAHGFNNLQAAKC